MIEGIKDKREREKSPLQRAQPRAALVVTSFNTPAQQERKREMLDGVVGKRERCKQKQKKEEAALLIESAEQLQKLFVVAFLRRSLYVRSWLTWSPVLFRQHGNVRAGLTSRQGEPVGNLRS